MTQLRPLGAAVLTALATLAIPAAAEAHPGIYRTTVKVLKANAATPPTQADLVDQVRYAIGNDGYAGVLRESNGLTGRGMVNYLLMPSGTPSYRATLTPEQKLANTSDAQAHATCVADPTGDSGAAKLNQTTNILEWQRGSTEAGTDPFYAYVPFQKATGGFGDTPSKWIALVKSVTGVDLDTATDLSAACTQIGGTYYLADAVQSTGKQFASANIADEVKAASDPLKAQADTLTAANAQLTTQVGSLLAQVAAANGAAASAQAQAASAATPLKLTIISKPAAGKLASSGLPVALAGAAGAAPRVRLLVGELKAKQLKLKSRVLATTSTTIKPDGTQSLSLKPAGAAATAIKRARGSLAVTVDALAGDRFSSATATLKR